ncbi:hypothetical protein [Streptomyces sp. NPDC005732]|uniref:hypothetical protein n=1 Tax=Streptomyces sp. NPDC005732 TaxID=3157057 RepID=UPI0033F33C44
MARYTIKYLDGESETVDAISVAHDHEADQYVFHAQERKYAPVALIPQGNVLSIHRHGDPGESTAATYPYQDGDVTVLGPAVFASADGEVISWAGANYSRRPGRAVTG